ncbi:multi antimicrobial extrusion protein [Kipferlia bialata]|uniref:Multi antimicrobial extrusion protein n=1 Tax=Kipferlia bialata TaxID=797122 RepID=A0A9K3GKZ8_9EUKA|nr:multi antimicrobial extrusion protein [Kipferlia bialata]|eukprot:g8775.t1
MHTDTDAAPGHAEPCVPCTNPGPYHPHNPSNLRLSVPYTLETASALPPTLHGQPVLEALEVHSTDDHSEDRPQSQFPEFCDDVRQRIVEDRARLMFGPMTHMERDPDPSTAGSSCWASQADSAGIDVDGVNMTLSPVSQQERARKKEAQKAMAREARKKRHAMKHAERKLAKEQAKVDPSGFMGTMSVPWLLIKYGYTVFLPVEVSVFASIGNVLGTGAAAMISRALGENDRKKAESILLNMLLVCTFVSVALPLVALPWFSWLLTLFGATETILPGAVEYGRILTICVYSYLFGQSLPHVLRSLGYERLSMYSVMGSAVLNMIVDPLLIFGFDMGIKVWRYI